MNFFSRTFESTEELRRILSLLERVRVKMFSVESEPEGDAEKPGATGLWSEVKDFSTNLVTFLVYEVVDELLQHPFVVIDAPVLVRFLCCYGALSLASQKPSQNEGGIRPGWRHRHWMKLAKSILRNLEGENEEVGLRDSGLEEKNTESTSGAAYGGHATYGF